MGMNGRRIRRAGKDLGRLLIQTEVMPMTSDYAGVPIMSNNGATDPHGAEQATVPPARAADAEAGTLPPAPTQLLASAARMFMPPHILDKKSAGTESVNHTPLVDR